MTFKTFTCSICGKETTKPKSYSLKDGTRACREHQVAQQDHDSRLEEEKREKLAEEQKRVQREAKREALSRPAEQHCWVCGKKGLDQRLFHHLILYKVAVWELNNGRPLDLMNPESCRQVAQMVSEVPCLWVCYYNETNKVYFFTRNDKMGAEITGLFLACGDCVREKKLVTIASEVIKGHEEEYKQIPFCDKLMEAVGGTSSAEQTEVGS